MSISPEPVIGQPLQVSFDERGRMWVVEYRQYPDPAGLTALSRDKYLRTVYDKVPPPPPNHFRGKDRISIHEDTNGDGAYDEHAVFVDGLNLATACAVGRGGVWVLNPPYLLFYADADGDDRPDGPPEVHLEGFGLEDSHSLANSLCWGPDGWLYAAQGSTVTGHVKRYGTDDPPVHSLGQLIWRYHPERRKYEIFAEGGGNTFGVEIDANGRIYSGHNGGDTRGFHYVQGGYYRKGFGKHGELSNPYAYGFFPHMPHHSVPRFTHAFIIYEGSLLSGGYAGKLFGVEPLQGRVVYSEVTPQGSSFATRDIGHALTSGDSWFRPVDIKLGPDGAIYVTDFYEQRIDHASHYQGRVTPESGRIYRLVPDGGISAKPYDLRKLSARELIDQLDHTNRTRRQIALRVIADRGDSDMLPILRERLASRSGQAALESLWAIYQLGGWSDRLVIGSLTHDDPHVRSWAVRLECDDHSASSEFVAKLVELAADESNAEVRSQLACSARRLPAEDCLAIVGEMLERDADHGDPYIPLLVWWAIEEQVADHADLVLDMIRRESPWDAKLFHEVIAKRLMRRLAASGRRADLLAAARLFELSPGKASSAELLTGFEDGIRGRSLSGIPDELAAALEKVGGGSLALRLRRGEEAALDEAISAVGNAKKPAEERIELINILGELKAAGAIELLTGVLRSDGDPSVRAAAASALGRFDETRIASSMLALHDKLPDDVRLAVQTALAGRAGWARQMLEAIDANQIDRELVPTVIIHQMLLHHDDAIASRVEAIYGQSLFNQEARQAQEVERLAALLSGSSGNPYDGKELYAKTCAKCHTLFGTGGNVGPDLTTFERKDVRRMLTNIVRPSLEIREGFETHVVLTADGRVVTGFLADADPQVVVLRSVDGQSTTVPRDEIDDQSLAKLSVMPEGLLKDYSEEQLRDLFAYLRSSQPLP